MKPTEIIYFTVTLFLALAELIQWKRRRDVLDVLDARLNRGLCGYVAARGGIRGLPVPQETAADTLIPV
jgi:hypothetical protein